MFVIDALAQTAAAAAPQASVASTLIQLALIFIVFYFILIRPQQKKISQHQAMLEVPSADAEPGTVLQELQAGYMIKDRLLRPAMVAVAKKGE